MGLARGLVRGTARGLVRSDGPDPDYVHSIAELEAYLITLGIAEADTLTTWDAIWAALGYATALAASNQLNSGGILKADIVAEIPSETLWISASTGSDDYWSIAGRDNTAQALKVDASKTVSKVQVELYLVVGSGVARIEFWDGPDRSTATQIGTASETTDIDYVVANGNPGQLFDFTWVSNPTLTSDCYLHVVPVSGSAIYIRSHTDETVYEDTDYDLWYSNDGSPAEMGGHQDLSFNVFST